MDIKFRAWNKQDKTMEEWNHVRTWEAFGYLLNSCFKEYIFMQYIGRADIEGNEIYDGDIFKDSCHTYIVYWNKGACGFKTKTIGGGKLIRPKYNNIEEVVCNLCVKGNKYQNPQLIN